MSGMKVSRAEKAARGHWSIILPALGVKVLENRHQPCPVCAGKDRFRFDDQKGGERGSVTSAGQVMAWR